MIMITILLEQPDGSLKIGNNRIRKYRNLFYKTLEKVSLKAYYS